MEKIMICELSPADGRKSFYGKAKVVHYFNLRRESVFELLSYSTTVCTYNSDTQKFTRKWYGYSATTMRHVNAFMRYLGFSYGGKAWWDSLPVGVPVKL